MEKQKIDRLTNAIEKKADSFYPWINGREKKGGNIVMYDMLKSFAMKLRDMHCDSFVLANGIISISNVVSNFFGKTKKEKIEAKLMELAIIKSVQSRKGFYLKTAVDYSGYNNFGSEYFSASFFKKVYKACREKSASI
jgi:hypothetical protein